MPQVHQTSTEDVTRFNDNLAQCQWSKCTKKGHRVGGWIKKLNHSAAYQNNIDIRKNKLKSQLLEDNTSRKITPQKCCYGHATIRWQTSKRLWVSKGNFLIILENMHHEKIKYLNIYASIEIPGGILKTNSYRFEDHS